MKSFFKSVFATITGIFISVLLIGFILALAFFAFMGIVFSSSSDSFELKDKTVLTLNLTGVMKDRTVENPFANYFDIGEEPELSLTDILSAIKNAKENDKIKGIYIRAGYMSASSASALELRNALEDFKTSGKFIISYADTYLQGAYFLSSVADKVILNPEGNLDLHGLSMGTTYYKGLLDKLDVEMQIFKVGTYKSYVEPYTSDKMSDANREQLSSIANNVWGTMLSKISESRGVSVEELNNITNELPAFKPTSYILEKGLIDTTMYEVGVKGYISELLGDVDGKDPNLASVSEFLSVKEKSKGKKSEEIAILYAEGSITSGSGTSGIQDRYLIKQIEKLKDNNDVKAVVFRVNSGGGSAYASEQIWEAITNLKKVKPVVVSMGGAAASGGYYISCNADKIYAEPTTITGSIGIFGMFPNVGGLVKKFGVTFDQVNTNKFSDFGDITRPMSADEKAILQQYIERGYKLFLTRCSEGRNIPMEKMEQIAEGRVWTGNQALEIGLVDALGGLEDAVRDAATLASVADYSIKDYPRKQSAFDQFFKNQKEEIAIKAMQSYLGSDFQLMKAVKEIKDMKQQDFIQARIEYDLEIQ